MKNVKLILVITLFFIPFFSNAQIYFLNNDEGFIRKELKKRYVVTSIEQGSSKLGSEIQKTLIVSFGEAIAAKDGNFKTAYYFDSKNNKCSAIKGLYYNNFYEAMINDFNKSLTKIGNNNWESEYFLFYIFHDQPVKGVFTFITVLKDSND